MTSPVLQQLPTSASALVLPAPHAQSHRCAARRAPQATFAATAVAIISGAVAERARLVAHALLSLIFGGWVYPVVVHWVWSAEGWLSARREAGGPILGGNGLIDLGGSGVVHVTAGAAALAGAYAIGARQGRFYADGGSQPMPAGSMVLVAAGVLMRW
jgi:Amt family ammonium transporter